MSSATTISDLNFISRETLASQFSASGSLPSSTAIIDVRDSDHIGGHIKGSTWVPSGELDYRLPELVRQLGDKETVVFHCALSQQRGPGAALRYLREKERLEGSSKKEGEGASEGKEGEEGKEEEGKGKKKEQRVVVLTGGFTEWQEKYGEDEKLTEGYVKDIWEFGS